MALCARLLAVLALFGAGVAQAQDGARYRVEVALDWRASADGPENPHWSRLIAFAHAAPYSLFADGATASSGLALVATNGRVTVLEAELAEARRRNRAGPPVVMPGLAHGTGTFAFELDVTARLRHVAFATMLAPSPDWFTGVSGVNLLGDEGWVATRSVPLWPWDAGADSGPDFTGPNQPTQPRESVRLLAHPAFLTDDGLRPIGRVTFTRLP